LLNVAFSWKNVIHFTELLARFGQVDAEVTRSSRLILLYTLISS